MNRHVKLQIVFLNFTFFYPRSFIYSFIFYVASLYNNNNYFAVTFVTKPYCTAMPIAIPTSQKSFASPFLKAAIGLTNGKISKKLYE